MLHTQTHTIWIVEDDKSYADTVSFILNNTSGLSCPQHFYAAEELLSFVNTPMYTIAPDLLLLDIQLTTGQSGIEALPEIKKRLPQIPVLMLTLYEDQHTILEALSAGADGYIIKDTPHDQLTRMIKEALHGQLLLAPRVKQRLLAHLKRTEKTTQVSLTDKQMEVLTLMCEGLGRKQVAERLGIKHATVDNHYRNIYDRLDVHSEVAAVVKALKEGIVPL